MPEIGSVTVVEPFGWLVVVDVEVDVLDDGTTEVELSPVSSEGLPFGPLPVPQAAPTVRRRRA